MVLIKEFIILHTTYALLIIVELINLHTTYVLMNEVEYIVQYIKFC